MISCRCGTHLEDHRCDWQALSFVSERCHTYHSSFALQGIVDAVAPDRDQSHDEILVRTPDISPSKLINATGNTVLGAAKKQHATPPIKDIRTSNLYVP